MISVVPGLLCPAAIAGACYWGFKTFKRRAASQAVSAAQEAAAEERRRTVVNRARELYHAKDQIRLVETFGERSTSARFSRFQLVSASNVTLRPDLTYFQLEAFVERNGQSDPAVDQPSAGASHN